MNSLLVLVAPGNDMNGRQVLHISSYSLNDFQVYPSIVGRPMALAGDRSERLGAIYHDSMVYRHRIESMAHVKHKLKALSLLGLNKVVVVVALGIFRRTSLSVS